MWKLKGAENHIKDFEVLKVEIHRLIKLLFVGFLFGKIRKISRAVATCLLFPIAGICDRVGE